MSVEASDERTTMMRQYRYSPKANYGSETVLRDHRIDRSLEYVALSILSSIIHICILESTPTNTNAHTYRRRAHTETRRQACKTTTTTTTAATTVMIIIIDSPVLNVTETFSATKNKIYE